MWAENKILCTFSELSTQTRYSTLTNLCFAEGFHNQFPLMNVVLDWWRRSNRKVSHLVVAEAEVKQKTCGGRWLCSCWTKTIKMLNKIRKRREKTEKLKRRGGGGGGRGKQRNWRNSGKNRSKKSWHYPSWNNWKTCQTENLHEIMQTSISKAFLCLYFHLWLVLNP